jgi:hypothetical protein
VVNYYPTIEEALAAGMFIDVTSDDIDFTEPCCDGSPERPYPAESTN